ncbi:hypothetical protein GCM10022229_12900 [Luteimonas lutimaris]|uniref:Secreted protein n=1 Tax=Luteimonas lutimaris TaxID=698645 RepID=A0ABP7MGR6_9GAMM
MFMFYIKNRPQGLFESGGAPTLAGTEERVSDMRRTVVSLVLLLAVPGLVQAAVECPGTTVPQATPVRPTVIAPVSSDLAAASYQLGTQASVLTQAYDESQSADQVLLRLRIEGCQDVAKAMPAPSAINPNDPAAYKPQTEFDNTPWRFDMSQGGKRMTADEFSAWMESRGVRVAKGSAPAPVAAIPVAVDGTVVPPAAVPAGSEVVPVQAPPAESAQSEPQPAEGAQPEPKPAAEVSESGTP